MLQQLGALQTHTRDTFLFISHTTNVLLFQFRCNIFIGLRIIKKMLGSVASGTHCISTYRKKHEWKFPLHFGSHFFRSWLQTDYITNISVLVKRLLYLIRWCKLMLCLEGYELTARSWNVLQTQTLKLNRTYPLTTKWFCLTAPCIAMKFYHELWQSQTLKWLLLFCFNMHNRMKSFHWIYSS